MKILFVDDEKAQRDSMFKTLTKLGYDVEVAGSSEEALKNLEKKMFPLIIIDLAMPRIDGMELCRQIRKINARSVIYAMSGWIAKFETDKLEAVGFDGYLSKPVKIEVLKRAIEGAFAKIKTL